MNITEYRAGSYQSGYEYKYFSPSKLNHVWVLSDPQIQQLLGEADRALGALSAFSQAVPDVDYFIQLHISKEATQSSKIEGTRTNIEEVFLDEKDIDPEKRDDWNEVKNYIDAINHAISELDTYPFCNRLLKAAHKILMRGVRGQSKLPGEFRESQNWIGVSLKDAVFVPPHHRLVVDLMSDLEIFLNNEPTAPPLIKIALAHYQFETIHPFLDGNGRLGRLMIALFLASSDLLPKPALYLSDYFERNKTEYIDRMMAVRLKHDLRNWLIFFLHGVVETSNNSIQVFKDVLALKSRLESTFLPHFSFRRQHSAQQLMLHLYQSPIVTIKSVAEFLGIKNNTAAALIHDFERHGVLRKMSDKKRNRNFGFSEYMSIFKRNPHEENCTQEDFGQEDLTQEDLTQEDLTQEDLTQEDLTQEDLTQEDVTQEDVTQEDVTQEDLTQEDVTQEDVTQEDVTQEDVTQEDVTQEDVTQEDVTQEDVTQTGDNQVNLELPDWKIQQLIVKFSGELSRAEIQTLLKLKDPEHTRDQYISPALELGYLEMTLPDKRTSKFQKYRLTEMGGILNQCLKSKNSLG